MFYLAKILQIFLFSLLPLYHVALSKNIDFLAIINLAALFAIAQIGSSATLPSRAADFISRYKNFYIILIPYFVSHLIIGLLFLVLFHLQIIPYSSWILLLACLRSLTQVMEFYLQGVGRLSEVSLYRFLCYAVAIIYIIITNDIGVNVIMCVVGLDFLVSLVFTICHARFHIRHMSTSLSKREFLQNFLGFEVQGVFASIAAFSIAGFTPLLLASVNKIEAAAIYTVFISSINLLLLPTSLYTSSVFNDLYNSKLSFRRYLIKSIGVSSIVLIIFWQMPLFFVFLPSSIEGYYQFLNIGPVMFVYFMFSTNGWLATYQRLKNIDYSGVVMTPFFFFGSSISLATNANQTFSIVIISSISTAVYLFVAFKWRPS